MQQQKIHNKNNVSMHYSMEYAYAVTGHETINYKWPPVHVLSEDLILNSNLSQRDLSARLENHQFEQLLLQFSPANRARLLSVSSGWQSFL